MLPERAIAPTLQALGPPAPSITRQFVRRVRAGRAAEREHGSSGSNGKNELRAGDARNQAAAHMQCVVIIDRTYAQETTSIAHNSLVRKAMVMAKVMLMIMKTMMVMMMIMMIMMVTMISVVLTSW